MSHPRDYPINAEHLAEFRVRRTERFPPAAKSTHSPIGKVCAMAFEIDWLWEQLAQMTAAFQMAQQRRNQSTTRKNTPT